LLIKNIAYISDELLCSGWIDTMKAEDEDGELVGLNHPVSGVSVG